MVPDCVRYKEETDNHLFDLIEGKEPLIFVLDIKRYANEEKMPKDKKDCV